MNTISNLKSLQKSFFASLFILPLVSGDLANANNIDLNSSLVDTNINNIVDILQQEQQMAQVTSVSQLSDVSPTDWAYEALRNLVERYGCIAGYPDRTFRGNRALSRYEFAAGLNACMQQIERLVSTPSGGGVNQGDLASLQRLVREFETELSTLGARVDNLEGKVAFLEDHQFSTTTKLSGEVIFTLANAFNNNTGSFPNRANAVNGEQTTFAGRTRLNFDTSFTGKDRLRVRLQAGNFERFGNSNMLRMGHDTRTGNNVELDDLFYRFPVGKRMTGFVGTNAMNIDKVFQVYNPYLASGSTGSLSRFLRRDPLLLRGPEGTGGGVRYKLTDKIGFNAVYVAKNGANPTDGNGLFDGGFSAGAQLTFSPSRSFNVGLAYLRTYENSGINLSSSTSSTNSSNPFGGQPTTSDRFGLQANWRLSRRVNVAGSVGYASANNLSPSGVAGANSNRADADLWTGAANISFLDVGKEGAVLTLAGGMPPRSQFERDTSYLVELQYRYPVNRRISITPGVYAVFNPEHDNRNDTVYVGVVRTTFQF